MLTESVTLGSMIDGTLFAVEAPSESGLRVTLSTGLTTTSDTEFTLSNGTLSVSDIVELGQELILVTAKSEDATPVYTASRGYYSSTAEAHSTGDLGVANPQFPRRRVADAIKRSLVRIEALGVPLVVNETLTRETDLEYVILPTDCRQVLQVMYIDTLTGRFLEVGNWREFSNLSLGRVMSVPKAIKNADELEVVYRKSYSFSDSPAFPDESSTVTLPSPAVDLPASYAAAWLVSAREISRQEIDRANEAAPDDQVRVQSGVGLMRALWQQFYRELDEVRRVVDFEVPKHRPWHQRPVRLV